MNLYILIEILFIISFESRCCYIQYKIYLAFKYGNFSLLKSFQKLFINSLVLRLKVVRNNIDLYSVHYLRKDLFTFDSKDKLMFSLNLKFNLNFDKVDYILISKKKSLSFFFEFPGLYISCVRSLYFELVSPIVETISDRFSLSFSPFRHSQDFFLQCKTVFSQIRRPFWFFISKFVLSFFSIKWIIKNFPFDKLLLNKYFNFIGYYKFTDNLFLILLNFLLNGLVRY